MTREEWTNRTFQKIDPKPDQERKKRMGARVVWFIYVPLGALVGFAATVVGQSGGFFFPVWGVTVLFMWAFNRSSE